MNKLFTILIAFISFHSSYAQEKQKDIESIKKMCGCYEVKFNFTETFQTINDSTHKPSPTKKDYGLEWVELVEDTPNKLVLQHLLIVSDNMIIKHWRQDWLYENTTLYQFEKDNTWKYVSLQPKDVKGQWTQKVYQVDDSPRYEGTASWIHKDGKDYWMNTTDAPLPRREHTIRKDYNVLERRNIHEITSYGWLHEQDNRKLVRDGKGNDTEIAQEKGLDLYVKVDNSKCLAAQNWWKVNQKLWKNVREKWQTVFNKKQNIQLESTVDNKPLFSHLFDLKPETKKEETDKIIDSFVK
ncbi:conserved hypothetical protein [Flavobacterium sp. 9AF]|uniref:DUF6607 family protein n=1 Tax=Flavobacterium sp. 9AF TaxID=2653142 RepID=UPI0012F223B7|nr:DUF6607 family protein [Flavobacterium sp. 9AF]VXB24291.1 conserved hypothetical protein [Flavobacterium sp. 9AF]